MDQNIMKHVQQNILQTNIRPLFADEALVAHTIKTGKDDKGKLTKEGHIFLIFVDATNHKPVDKIALSPLTARALYGALGDALDKLDIELKSKAAPKKAKVETDYIR